MKPLDQFELNTLGRYNAEVERGLLHSAAWEEQMRRLQERFNAQYGPIDLLNFSIGSTDNYRPCLK